MKNQIPIKILTTANSNDLNKSSVVLIKANQIDTEKLVGLAERANAKIHALVNYLGTSDVLNLLQNLSNQGFVEGSYVFINIEDVGNINEIQSIYSNLRQGGYYVGLVNTVKGFANLNKDDIKNISFYKMVDQDGDNSITVRDADGYINGLNVDLTGKLNQQPITRSERNTYTNVDVSTDSKGWVGIGQDTVLGGGKGFGYSTMGNDFNTVISPKGIIFRRPDAERMWKLLRPKQQAEVSELLDHTVADEIKNQLPGLEKARQQADSAVKFAESAIAASKVNSDAQVAMNSAIAEAKATADSALSDIQQAMANASSDAAQIRQSVADVQNEVNTAKNANESSVTKLKSEIANAKKHLATVDDQLSQAQSAVADTQAKINSNVASIENEIASNKADIKQALSANSTVANQLDVYTKQAQEQRKTIKAIQDKQDGFSIAVADIKGNVTEVTDTVDGLTAKLKDTNGNVANVQAQAKKLQAILSDNKKNVDKLLLTATRLSNSISDAEGRLSTIEQTSKEQSTTLSDVQGDLTQVKQTAVGLTNTLKDAQGNIDQLQQTAKGTTEQISNAQADIVSLQKDVNGIKLTIADHEKNIHTLQADSKSLRDDMKDAQGNISSLQKTATSLDSEFKDQDGRLSKVEQTATEHTSELADTKGNLDKVTQKANSLQLLFGNAQKDIQNIKLDAKGLHDTLTGQGNQLASLNVTLNNLDSKYSGVTGDLRSKQTVLSTEQQQTKDMLLRKADKSEVDNVKGTVNQVSAEQKTMADQINQKVSSTEYQTLKDKVNGLRIGGRNLLSNSETDIVIESNTTDPWPAWKYKVAYWNLAPNVQYTFSTSATNTNGVREASVRIFNEAKNKEIGAANFCFPADGKRHSKTFSVPDDGTQYSVYLYAGHMGNIEGKNFVTTYHHPQLEMGNVESDYSPNPDDAIASIKKNSTAINENSRLISLMAKQTDVDNIKGTAQQLSARLDVMAGEVKSKLDETRVNNLINSRGYATSSTVQSLLSQKAGQLSESITNLEGKFNSSSSINLAEKTNQGTTNWMCDPGTGATNLTEININGVRGVRFNNTRKSTSWWVAKYVLNLDNFEPNQDYIISFDIRTSSDNFSQGGMLNIARGDSSHAYLANTSFKTHFKKNQLTHVSCTGHSYGSLDKNGETFYLNCLGLGQCDWVDFVNFKIAQGTIDKGYSPAPSDNATVTQVQNIQASIDGLQSNVTNYKNNTNSRFTQLSNLVQSKVGTADFNNLKRAVDMQTLDSADINNMKTNGHYFVRNLANNPIGGWVYVDVTGNGNDRIRQDVYQDSGIKHKYRRWFGTYWTGWEEGATYSEINQLQDAINLRVQKGELMSQINLQAGNTLIQSNKLYLDSSSVVFSGRAFIPSAAIANLSADKVTSGWLNTNNVSLGDGRTRIRADHDYLYIQPTGSAATNTGIRMSYTGLDFLTNDIPNGYNSPIPYYGIGYDGAANGYLTISAFDHLNPGGATANQNWYTMAPAISLNNREINFAARGNMHMQVVDGGVNVKPTLFLQNSTNNGTWVGFTRLNNSNTVEFNTGDNNGENFHVNSGARFMQYVYINGYARAQGWLTNSTLSKKTNIRKLDTSTALTKIRQDEQYLYEYKRNVAKGIYDPQASFIIDDVNDVSHYSVPREFIDQSGNYREPNVELAYLIAAFQEIDKQVQLQKEEVKQLKEKLQHE